MQSKSFGRLVKTSHVIVVSVVLFLPGCATTSDANRTRTEGAAAGAVIGGLLGGVLGGNNKSALIGAAIGGIVGLAVGDHVVKKKEAYASTEDYLQDVIRHAEQTTAQSKQLNATLKADIAGLKQRQAALSQQTLSAQQRSQQIATQTRETQALISKTGTALAQINDELAFQRRVIAEERNAVSNQLITVAENGISDLDIQQRELQRALVQLKMIDNRKAY